MPQRHERFGADVRVPLMPRVRVRLALVALVTIACAAAAFMVVQQLREKTSVLRLGGGALVVRGAIDAIQTDIAIARCRRLGTSPSTILTSHQVNCGSAQARAAPLSSLRTKCGGPFMTRGPRSV